MSPTTSDGLEEEAVYEVECIIGSRCRQGEKQYLVKWKGYGPEENSWEPLYTLSCSDTIKKYELELHQEVVKVEDSAGKYGYDPKKSGDTFTTNGDILLKENSTSTPNEHGDELVIADDEISVLEDGRKPDKIIGCSDTNGVLKFVMKWFVLHCHFDCPRSNCLLQI